MRALTTRMRPRTRDRQLGDPNILIISLSQHLIDHLADHKGPDGGGGDAHGGGGGLGGFDGHLLKKEKRGKREREERENCRRDCMEVAGGTATHRCCLRPSQRRRQRTYKTHGREEAPRNTATYVAWPGVQQRLWNGEAVLEENRMEERWCFAPVVGVQDARGRVGPCPYVFHMGQQEATNTARVAVSFAGV